MISHELKCIFIHIPRCAGTSIETWLHGCDWWEVDPATKHLTAGQARRIYAPWWDAYFKFSIVRDPFTRTASLLKFSDHFGLRKSLGEPIDFSGYERLFGSACIVEHDHRFTRRDDILRAAHRPSCVYGNILDEPLDFIGKFETLAADMAWVQRRLAFAKSFDLHVERSSYSGREPLTVEDRAWVATAYADDFRTFGYSDDGEPASASIGI